MLKFVLRRLVALVPQLLIASLVIFVLTSLMPGDAAIARAGSELATPELIARYRAQLGLDDPLYVRFFQFVGNRNACQSFIHGNIDECGREERSRQINNRG